MKPASSPVPSSRWMAAILPRNKVSHLQAPPTTPPMSRDAGSRHPHDGAPDSIGLVLAFRQPGRGGREVRLEVFEPAQQLSTLRLGHIADGVGLELGPQLF